MRFVYMLLSLCLFCLHSGCKAFSQKKSVIRKQDNIYVLSFADCSFSVSSEKGGRVVSFKCGGKELLTSDSIHDKYYGATFWLSPQSDYWPPYQSVDNLPYTAEIDGKKLRLTNSLDTINGLSITKEFVISEVDSSMLISYSIQNIARQPKKLAPWDVVRVYGGMSFFPIGEANEMNKLNVAGSYEDNGIIWVPYSNGTNKKAQKLYSTASGGWMAYYNEKGLLFIKCFPDITLSEVPPGQGEVEIYVAPDGKYIELENHGKYIELQPGDSSTYLQKWFLRDVSVDKDFDLMTYLEKYINKEN